MSDFLLEGNQPMPTPLSRASEPRLRPSWLDRAYASGLFDGEGCVYIARLRPESSANRPRFQLQTVVSNTNRDVLDWLWMRWGGYVLVARRADGKTRASWQWRLQGPRQEGGFVIRVIINHIISARRVS